MNGCPEKRLLAIIFYHIIIVKIISLRRNMSLPANFTTPPGEDPHRYFRNTCIEFKKLLKNTKDIDSLQIEMEKFIGASKQLDWKHKTTGVYHKSEGEKAAEKVWNEFKRYILVLATNPYRGNPHDLIDALSETERLVESLNLW